ncbi:MAG TPA: DUF1579 family protein [Candidatus Polarisedimenticolaceae bacterium]|nr:DUF1579 family protein [Candidatus Polarisedimenticolaceae bacterium]
MIAALALGLAAAAAAAPPSVDEIVRRYVEARGGAPRWQALEALEWNGTCVTFSKAAPCSQQRKRPNALRFEYQLNGRPATVGYDGRTAWWINPMMSGDVGEMPPADARALEADSDFDSALFDWRAKGHQVELLGQETLEGHPTYKLRVTRQSGAVETWYLDAQSFLEVARESPGSDFGQEMRQWTWYSDFRDVGGMKLPFHREIEYGTRTVQLQIADVRPGVALEAARFRMPPPVGMDKLQDLVGEFEVKLETRPDPRAPWTELHTRSRVESLMAGGLLSERLSVERPEGKNELLRTLSYDRFRKCYRLTEFDSDTKYQNVLEGTLGEDGKLVLSNEATKTTWSGYGMNFNGRLVAYEIGAGGFKLDSDLSTDGGTTWTTFARYVYTRAPAGAEARP